MRIGRWAPKRYLFPLTAALTITTMAGVIGRPPAPLCAGAARKLFRQGVRRNGAHGLDRAVEVSAKVRRPAAPLFPDGAAGDAPAAPRSIGLAGLVQKRRPHGLDRRPASGLRRSMYTGQQIRVPAAL